MEELSLRAHKRIVRVISLKRVLVRHYHQMRGIPFKYLNHSFYHFTKLIHILRVRSETGGSRMKALKMSIVHVSTFVLFWTPYSVMATW